MLVKVRRRFHRACADYGLLVDGDRILVAVSGGKDSLLLTQLLAEQARLHKPSIQVAAAHVVMDNIPYETSTEYLTQFCANLGIPLHILHSSFDESTDKRKTKCFLCAWYRRKALFQFAESNGYNKVALGHHQDDIISTWLMNVVFEGNATTMPPLLQMRNYPLDIIRPLCLVPESWIAQVAESAGFCKQKRACPYESATRRTDMEGILKQIEAMNPEARYSLWRAMGMDVQK